MIELPLDQRIDRSLLLRAAVSVVERLSENGYSAFIVGGAVRDLLIGGKPKDFDVATNATPEQIVALFRGARIIGRRFRIVHVRMGREIIEVTTFRGSHKTDDSNESKTSNRGLLLRDNVYGTLEEDAVRRDLTVNALYLDVVNNTILDHLNALEDIDQRLIRVIGDPKTRYQEDPVRMLRVARFAAKLDFDIEADTEQSIAPIKHLLADIPSARLFDEALKLFMSGYGLQSFERLEHLGLLEVVLPEAAENLQSQSAQIIIKQALGNTDQRIARDKPCTPAFLFAAMLWPAVEKQSIELSKHSMSRPEALNAAGQQVTQRTVQRVAIPKRFSIPMREIWSLQHRLEHQSPKRIKPTLSLRRFRAAFDLLLLRAEASPDSLRSAVAFWEEQQKRYPDIVGSQPEEKRPPRKRRRRQR